MMIVRRLRWVVTLATLLLLLPALAGCFGADMPTAKEAVGMAQGAAEEWDAGARLVFAGGLEGKISSQLIRDAIGDELFSEFGFEKIAEEEDAWEHLEEDKKPGNGKAPIWVLYYVSGDGARELVILLDHNGEVLYQEEMPVSVYDVPVGTFSLDSDAAMSKARSASSDLRDAVRSSNMIVGSALHFDEDHGGPVWSILAIGGDFTRIALAVVQLDASTGEVIHEEGHSFGM